MKKFFFQLTILVLVALFTWNCSSGKKRITASSTAVKNDIEISEIDAISKEGFNLFPETTGEKKWVDSVYNSLSFEEKLGQLFMVAAYSNKDTVHFNSLEKLVKNYKIGGLIFFQGGPFRQAKLTNRFQASSKVPLFLGNDAEWGLSMRLDSTYKYPWNMTLGAIQDMKLIEELGGQMAKEAKLN